MSLEMAHSRDSQSCSLMDGCCHTIAMAVLDEKGAHFTNGREETAECFIL